MASGAIILVLMVLLTVILMRFLESRYHVIFSQVVNMTYILVGSMMGIIVAAIIANSVICFYKRRENLAIQEHGVGGQVFVFATQKSAADTSSYTSSTNFTQHSNLAPQIPACLSCQCSNVPYVPQQKNISPTINHKDIRSCTQIENQMDREITDHSPRADVFVDTRPTVVAVDVHNNIEKVEIPSGNSGQLESDC
ncbi:unnamed protein product [Arctia plantaginis]|uniref:Uncharacterized protein n=1 Tax=Arctia plantaginis TaxID=874455 RepID=A0A8S1A7W7_ARCPL|nr:unnamed protein product [Arctia plantaginis]